MICLFYDFTILLVYYLTIFGFHTLVESDIDIDEISYTSPIHLWILLESLNKVKSLIYKMFSRCLSVDITSAYNFNLSIRI